MSRSAEYLALAQALTDTLTNEVTRLKQDPTSRLERARFAAAASSIGFNLADFPLAALADDDMVFVTSLESLVQALFDIAWLLETVGDDEVAFASAMQDFFASPLLPEGLPRPTTR